MRDSTWFQVVGTAVSRAAHVLLCKFASSNAWTHSHLRVLNLPIYARQLLGRHLATPTCRSRVALASLHARIAGDRNPSTTVPSLVSILLLCHVTEEERPYYSVCVERQPGVASQLVSRPRISRCLQGTSALEPSRNLHRDRRRVILDHEVRRRISRSRIFPNHLSPLYQAKLPRNRLGRNSELRQVALAMRTYWKPPRRRVRK